MEVTMNWNWLVQRHEKDTDARYAAAVETGRAIVLTLLGGLCMVVAVMVAAVLWFRQ
jgi:hypothetical protein